MFPVLLPPSGKILSEYVLRFNQKHVYGISPKIYPGIYLWSFSDIDAEFFLEFVWGFLLHDFCISVWCFFRKSPIICTGIILEISTRVNASLSSGYFHEFRQQFLPGFLTEVFPVLLPESLTGFLLQFLLYFFFNKFP